MAGLIARRSILLAGAAAAYAAGGRGGAVFPSEWRRITDAATDTEVLRLTDPANSSILPSSYNQSITRGSATLLYSCDRGSGPQACLMDLKTGRIRELTAAEALDPASLGLLRGERTFAYCSGRKLCVSSIAAPHERVAYTVPEGWQLTPGASVTPDGAQALLVEAMEGRWRLRAVPLSRGQARTVVETPFAISAPVARSGGDILYRQDDETLWLTSADGRQNRRLATPAGRVTQAAWNPTGKSILYLHTPAAAGQLNAIREYFVETGDDKLMAKTSQFASFGFNRNTSVFVGASASKASPAILLLLRLTRREFTLCEHRASRPEAASPMFSPDAQRVYFQSDRSGKPAIYSVHVEQLVEKIQEDAK